MPAMFDRVLLGPSAWFLLPALISSGVLAACDRPAPHADAVYHNARIITMEDGAPKATAMAVGGERILAVGSFEEVTRLAGEDTEIHDLQGRNVIPGINETHIHVRDLGFEQHFAVNLEPARTIEDIQVLLARRLGELREMAEYGVIAAINPANLYFEGESFLRNLGPERMARHTPYRTFLDAGVVMASGSDYPNNSPDPWIGIYQMVTRKDQITGQVHGPEQRISLFEALKTFTINGAYLTYDEEVRGSLTPGKLADFVVLDADLLAASEEDLLDMSARVLLTVVGGRTVYRQGGLDPG